jgi:predicted nucleic acid-binding protein
MTYALDTNIISHFLWGEGEVEKRFDEEIVKAGNPYVIPPVVVYEIKRWLMDNPGGSLSLFAQEFELLYREVRDKADMPAVAWEKAADIFVQLKQKGQMIGTKDVLTADLLIAAYCIVNDYTLVTNNTRHFERIDGLKLTNWMV